MDKGRVFLFLGAGLTLISMPLVAFSFNSSGTDTIFGYQVWYISFLFALDRGFGGPHPITFAMMLCALFNLFQLVYPFIKNPLAGTSKGWIYTFCAIGLVILPALSLYFQISEDSNVFIYREGYFAYQAGYIFSALGFIRKAKIIKGLRTVYPTTEEICSYI